MNHSQPELNKLQRRFFEEDIKRQLHYLQHPLHRYQKERRYMHAIEMAQINETDTILEVGCAIGYQIPLIVGKCKKYVGIDFSESAIKLNRKRNKSPKVKVLCMDARKIKFKKNLFDVVLLIDVIEDLYDQEKVLSQIKKVLKPGGRLVVSAPNEKSLYGLAKNIWNKPKWFDRSIVPPIHRWYDKNLLIEILSKHGFIVTDVRGSFFLPPFFTGKRYLIPSYKIIPKIYNFFENFLSRSIKSLGYHIIICAKNSENA
ncbi:MAG: methyltransferase domain-containing protein [Candidatus Aenigmarchaeota archaeon]|nr:methyltransferase domain-containing protein [Candidatus Aenigmarchaeota archaeon]